MHYTVHHQFDGKKNTIVITVAHKVQNLKVPYFTISLTLSELPKSVLMLQLECPPDNAFFHTLISLFRSYSKHTILVFM